MLLEICFASKHMWIWKILIDPQISKKRLYNKLNNVVEHVYVSLECKESLLNTLIRSA